MEGVLESHECLGEGERHGQGSLPARDLGVLDEGGGIPAGRRDGELVLTPHSGCRVLAPSAHRASEDIGQLHRRGIPSELKDRHKLPAALC